MGARCGRACVVVSWALCAELFVPTGVGLQGKSVERLLAGAKPGGRRERLRVAGVGGHGNVLEDAETRDAVGTACSIRWLSSHDVGQPCVNASVVLFGFGVVDRPSAPRRQV